MKRMVILLLTAFLISGVWAESPSTEHLNTLKKRTPTIAIFPLENSNELAEKHGYGQTISSMLNTHLRNETNFMVLERSQLKRVIDEKALKDIGVTEETRAKLMKLHSVEVILTGEVSYLNGTIQIDTRLVSTSNGEVAVAEYAVIDDHAELRNTISELAKVIEIKYLRQWMGNLKITAFPVEGEVYLDGQFMGKTEGSEGLNIKNLLEGSYKLKVMAGGYKNHEGIIEIKPRTNRDIQIIMESLPGKLSILSEPNGAEVTLNNKTIGTTPLNVDTLKEGKYEVKLRKKNFLDWSEKIVIQSGQLSEIKGLMEVIPGNISVTSNPKNAVVYLDDVRIGLTPLLIKNKKPGSSTLKITKNLYQDFSEQIQIKPGETTNIEKDLLKLTGTLTLVSTQEGTTANVTHEDGRLIFTNAKLPLHKEKLPIGQYTVTLNKEGYFPHIQEITIATNKEVRIDTQLQERPALVTISNKGETPIDIYIDGRYIGNLNETLIELPRGSHEITMKSIYTTESQTIELDINEQKTITVAHTDKRFNIWTIPLSIIALASLIFIGGN